jgi:hypothetical protein
MSIFKLAYYVLRGLFASKKKKQPARSTAELNVMSLRMYVEDNLDRLVAITTADGLGEAVDMMAEEIPNFYHKGTYEPIHLLLRDALRKKGHTDSDLHEYATKIVELLKSSGHL